MIDPDRHLQIGSLLFEGLDQIDLTGPFEVLSRIPNATYRIYATNLEPVKDVNGLRFVADAILSDAPKLDVLHVPGGHGQEPLMDDEAILDWIRAQADCAFYVFPVCTGALLLGSAQRATGARITCYTTSARSRSMHGSSRTAT